MFQKAKQAVIRFIDEHLEQAAVYLLGHSYKVAAADIAFSLAMYFLGLGSWALWAHVLLVQNWAFTFVSRARNSGSLTRHLQAGFLSNGVWWISQIIIYTKLTEYLKGSHGIRYALLAGLYYTAFTLSGSLLAHAQALRTEKGKAAVGASKKYAQVSIEDWAKIQEIINDYKNTKELAENAYACAVGALPTGAVATKVAGQTVISGPPELQFKL